MILKLITIVYAWVWNVQPWQPIGGEDWGLIAGISVFLDPLAVMGLILIIAKICYILQEDK